MGYKERILLLAGCFFLLHTAAFAQGSLTGTVTDKKTGDTMPGTNVSIQSINKGASTDADGHYTISNIPPGTYTLTVSFIGYKKFSTQVKITDGEQQRDIELVPEVIGMEDVVVTALGIEREEKSLGYATQEVEGKDIQNSQQTNVVSSLAGMTSGVQISGSSGDPGSPARITIRGNSSFTGNNQPLFVVDGVPVSNSGGGGDLFEGASPSRAIDLDPNIIKSVNILKGASATALYGSRAANGAVIITTKGGEMGKEKSLQVELNSSVNFSTPIIDGYQDTYLQGSQGKFSNGLPLSRGGYLEPGYPGSDPQTFFSWGPAKDEVSQQVLNDLGVDEIETYDPREQFFDTGVKFDNNISISGGEC